MFPEELLTTATKLLEHCRKAGLMVVTAESCTGGLIAGCLTEIAGSSDVVERGFVTYSNAAKMELLDVPEALLATKGAVSAEVAEAMAQGALAHSRADIAVSVTGVAGPGGGSAAKPVGLVFMGLCRRGDAPSHRKLNFPGARSDVRRATVQAALAGLGEMSLGQVSLGRKARGADEVGS
ncbi:CinA family protein [Denitrobaculum tricleocarpae]|uniref:CinA family protein n=1 Tax=Denitrobaculum tricleocarpae TaxID=2591009 RepID=A0A545TPP3_9PROT|nr:CinA family protein [Denitrobaculum tricleocarpae]TQV79190.1 CinA family protein [Denitrobaculum tricleocarpae]